MTGDLEPSEAEVDLTEAAHDQREREAARVRRQEIEIAEREAAFSDAGGAQGNVG